MIHRPKILTAITVPTGGWDLVFKVSSAATLDTQYTATVAAGTYYLAWDGQTDDLLYALSKAMYDVIAAGIGGARYPYLSINSANKVVFQFNGSAFVDSVGHENDVSLLWASSDAGLANALGFDSTASDTSTATDNPTFTGDWQHGYGWYASEDGQLRSLLIEDVPHTNSPQEISYAGWVSTQQLGTRYTNQLDLAWLTRAQLLSRGVSYGTASVDPYDRNVPLECWWREASQGIQFRVYREGRNTTDGQVLRFVNDTADTVTCGDADITMGTDPQDHAGRIVHFDDRLAQSGSQPGRWYISSHTATVFTVPVASADGQNVCPSGSYPGYVLDMRYGTYVLDTSAMQRFSWTEHEAVDRYDISIPLLRYES